MLRRIKEKEKGCDRQLLFQSCSEVQIPLKRFFLLESVTQTISMMCPWPEKMTES